MWRPLLSREDCQRTKTMKRWAGRIFGAAVMPGAPRRTHGQTGLGTASRWEPPRPGHPGPPVRG